MSEVATTSNGALLSFIERAAKDPDFNVEKFGELLRLQREVSHDQARRAFNQAMASAQAEMLPVVRDAKNSHLNNRYAKLETIDAAMRPIYTRHGFSVRYGSAPASEPGQIRITCTIAHEGGYFEEQYLDAPVGAVGSQGGRTATTPVQAVGSAITYLRRYLLSMCWNVVLADDDDGEGQRRTVTPPKVERTTEQWTVWLEKLKASCATLYKRTEIEELASRDNVVAALADAPPWAREEIEKILADAFARFAAPPPAPAEDVVA